MSARSPAAGYVSVFLTLSTLVATGCASKNYTKPITGFQTASNEVIIAAKSYYELANKVERDHLIDDQLTTRDPIDPQELRKVSGTFRPEDIAVRLEALGVLADYGTLLLQLATSNAPADVTTQVDGLTDSVGILSDRLTKLCTDCTEGNTKFKTAFGAVATVIKPILDQIVRSKIERGLNTNIQNAEKPVSDLIIAVRQDLNGLYARRKQAVEQSLSDATKAYNDEAKKRDRASADRLQTLAARVKLTADRVEQLPTASPDAALIAMDKAHRALVSFAKQKKTPQSLADLADAVQAFAVQAQQVSDAVRTLVTL